MCVITFTIPGEKTFKTFYFFIFYMKTSNSRLGIFKILRLETCKYTKRANQQKLLKSLMSYLLKV